MEANIVKNSVARKRRSLWRTMVLNGDGKSFVDQLKCAQSITAIKAKIHTIPEPFHFSRVHRCGWSF